MNTCLASVQGKRPQATVQGAAGAVEGQVARAFWRVVLGKQERTMRTTMRTNKGECSSSGSSSISRRSSGSGGGGRSRRSVVVVVVVVVVAAGGVGVGVGVGVGTGP